MIISIGLAAAAPPAWILAADAPTTAPAGDDIAGLIARLGDPDFHVRSDASNRLREIGAPALPALKQAAESDNPEVRSRARQIVHVLEYHHVPGRPMLTGRTRSYSVNRTAINGRQTVDINDQGRRITIKTGEDGIEMTVTGEIDGHPATETYKAATCEQLQAENPEAFALYNRSMRGSGNFDEVGGNIILQGNGNIVFLPPMQPGFVMGGGGDDLVSLREKIDDQMNKGNLSPAQKKQVHDAIDDVEHSRPNAVVGPADAIDDRMRRYDKACDDLRQVLADLKLPDPGPALPPPSRARLGISVRPDPLTGGLAVARVFPGSRADRIGLQDDDVIRKINGADVADVKDLRRLVTEHAKGLALDITRDGREMKLQEK